MEGDVMTTGLVLKNSDGEVPIHTDHSGQDLERLWEYINEWSLEEGAVSHDEYSASNRVVWNVKHECRNCGENEWAYDRSVTRSKQLRFECQACGLTILASNGPRGYTKQVGRDVELTPRQVKYMEFNLGALIERQEQSSVDRLEVQGPEDT
jgi:predicted RNA-binding Zn-ribbon protein involved in translation (DUF1610 family)